MLTTHCCAQSRGYPERATASERETREEWVRKGAPIRLPSSIPPETCMMSTADVPDSNPKRDFPCIGAARFEAKRKNEMAADGGACIICLDTSPPPIQSGCACRGDSGLAHIACLVQAAASQQAQRGSDVWQKCQTCKQYFTGAMRSGLAEAWRSRVAGQAAENTEWLEAESYVAVPLLRAPREGRGGGADVSKAA